VIPLTSRAGLFGLVANDPYIGIAFRDVNFKDVNGKLFPTVGLKKPGDHILANFGQVPFQFDIDGYMKVCHFRHMRPSSHNFFSCQYASAY